MNCKLGDLAVIVISPNPAYVGLFVDVIGTGDPKTFLAPYAHLSDTQVWKVRASRLVQCTNGGMYQEFYMPDGALRPIRPDGITTEEVTQLYSPSPVKEVA